MVSEKDPLGGWDELADIGADVDPSCRLEYRRLLAARAQQNIAKREHLERSERYRGVLNALASDCVGVDCPEVKESGQALAAATGKEFGPAMVRFSEAVRLRAREPADDDEAGALQRLSLAAMTAAKAMNEETAKAVTLDKEVERLMAQALKLKAPGGIH